MVESPDKLLQDRRVLVVDDSKDICFLWRLIFEKQGAEVRAAESAEEALNALKNYAPDVIVSDLSMPGLDGFALMEHLKNLSLRRMSGGSVPVIAVTAHDDPALRERSIQAGFAEYVLKPVTASDLVGKVAGLFEPREWQKPSQCS
jgi:CheY-like chemotaxis protein